MKQRVRKAVFPVAGLGTRFLPATKALPKEMLPLVDKPIIQYGVEEALAAGCDQIILITGRGKTAIEDHFDVSYELEKMLEERNKTELLTVVRQISDMIHVAYVRQKEALGLGHAVLMARELVGNEPFAVLLADDIIDSSVPCLKQMMDVFEETQSSVLAIQEIDPANISAYGVLDAKPAPGRFAGRLYEISNLVEKPKREEAPSNLAIVGRYILTPKVFETLARTPLGSGGELQLTDGMKMLLRQEKMYGGIMKGINTMLESPVIREAGKAVGGKLKVPGADIPAKAAQSQLANPLEEKFELDCGTCKTHYVFTAQDLIRIRQAQNGAWQCPKPGCGAVYNLKPDEAPKSA